MTAFSNVGFANNSYSYARQVSEKSAFMPLKSPPEFAVQVNERSVIAKLTGCIDIPVQWQLVVEFSDGVTEMFYRPHENSKEWFSANKKNYVYAKAVTNKLGALVFDNATKFGKD